jgi:tetratricopeptide (TPR) repeat protein
LKDPLQGPPTPNHYFMLGKAYEKDKQHALAMQNFKKALSMSNTHFGACMNLASLLSKLGEGKRAAKYFTHALKIDPDFVNAHFGLGKATSQFSTDRKAIIKHYDEVLKRDPSHYKTLT